MRLLVFSLLAGYSPPAFGKKIGKIRIHQSSAEADPENPITDKLDISGERTIIIAPHLKSIRLEVFVIDENAWYNIPKVNAEAILK
jgi:hypothetical protein